MQFFFSICAGALPKLNPSQPSETTSRTIHQPHCLPSVPVWCEPIISPRGPHVVVPKRGKLELRCHDNATTPGAPSGLRWQRERARRLEGEVEEGGVVYVRVPSVQAFHMGRYVCVNNSTLEHSSIYVYVKGGLLVTMMMGVKRLVILCTSIT